MVFDNAWLEFLSSLVFHTVSIFAVPKQATGPIISTRQQDLYIKTCLFFIVSIPHCFNLLPQYRWQDQFASTEFGQKKKKKKERKER